METNFKVPRHIPYVDDEETTIWACRLAHTICVEIIDQYIIDEMPKKEQLTVKQYRALEKALNHCSEQHKQIRDDHFDHSKIYRK
jgi:hypothetical protein